MKSTSIGEQTANAEGKEKETEPKKLQGKLNLAMKKIYGGKLKVEVEGENGKVANGPKAPTTKPKRRKWKMQATQDDKIREKGAELQNGPNIAKRPATKVMGRNLESPETKRPK